MRQVRQVCQVNSNKRITTNKNMKNTQEEAEYGHVRHILDNLAYWNVELNKLVIYPEGLAVLESKGYNNLKIHIERYIKEEINE